MPPSSPTAVPSGPASSALSPSAPAARSPGPDLPAGLVAAQQIISGVVGSLADGRPPCYVERYPCERYPFTMRQDGAVEATLAWQGGDRAMLIQLYRAGAGLVHEDLAARGGPPQITFRRTDLAATDYELRVVNMDPATAHAFTLTLTTWQ